MKLLRIVFIYVGGVAAGLFYVATCLCCAWLAIVAWELLTFALRRFGL